VRRTLGSPYTYTAIFENEPTASAPAYQVRVVDKLDPSRLNLNSLRLGPVRFGSHAVVPPPDVQNWSTQVDMRPAENIRVNVAAGLDRKSATLTWVLTAIDGNTGQPVTSATSGFLPPDSVPPEGDGAVSFTVTPKAGLRTGARIGNGARIFFDTNAPIDTRTWINTIDGTPPSSSRIIRVTPSSTVVHFKQRHRTRARRYPSLTVRWTAHDRGSGPAAYDLFASSGRSRFTRVLGGADATAVHVICKRGRRYRFYVRAYDAAGNAQNGHSSIARPVRCR
jgi:hypothetical protein